MVCDRCEVLEAELAVAREKLGELDGSSELTAMKRWLGLSKTRGRMVLRLYRTKGRFLPDWLLAEEMQNPDADAATIKVMVHQMRRILGEGMIETSTVYGGGYRLSPAMMLRVRDALTAGA